MDSNLPKKEPPSPRTELRLKLKSYVKEPPAKMNPDLPMGPPWGAPLDINESPSPRPEDPKDDPNVLFSSRSCVVKRHGDVVIKSGDGVAIEERDALDLAARFDLPVPRVYNAETLPPPRGGASISMDYISGETLDKIWGSLSAEERRSIALQLREIIDKMRSFKSDSNSIRGCSGDQILDCRSYHAHPGGPFPDEKSFNAFWVEMKHAPTAVREACRKRLRSNHRIVLTHGDISPRNIMVKDKKVVAVIDWEFAGWFPEYWEYVKFFERPTHHRDWYEYSNFIFSEAYDDELVDYWAISHWQPW